MTRFVEINGHHINADNIDTIEAKPVEYMGWAYTIDAVMSGGNRIQLEQIRWDPAEWGNFHTPAADYAAANRHIQQRLRDITSHIQYRYLDPYDTRA